MQMVEVNNANYAIEFHQQNAHLPYLLMLHGFMGDHRAFDHLIDGLTECCNPITIDLLGFGKSSKPDNPERYSESNQVRDICKIFDKLELNQSHLFLFGYSMGGRLALKIAINSPSRFEGLLLESTNCGISDPDERKERRRIDAERARKIKEDFDDFLSGWKELKIFDSPLAENETLVRNYQQMQSEQSPSALAASLLGFGTGSMTPTCDDLQKLKIPVLLIAGSGDEKYQRINRYMKKLLPNAIFTSIKAGHRTHLDNPEGFIEKIKDFIIHI